MARERDNGTARFSVDWLTILIYIILMACGWASVCGACYDYNHPDLLAWSANSGKQIVWMGTSIALGSILLLVDRRYFDSASHFIYAAMLLLLAVTIFIAPDTHGSRSWIPIGSSMKLQPAEFAKFATALALAKLLSKKDFDIDRARDVIMAGGVILLPMLLILAQKETGTALVYLVFFLVLYREGMTGTFLFAGFACVVSFVVGMKFRQETIPDMPVSVGEFASLILALLATISMVWTFIHNRLAALLIGGVSLIVVAVSLLFSTYVIPFNVCVPLTSTCILAILSLLVMAARTRQYKYLLVALFATAFTAIYHISDTAISRMPDHQRTRIEVLLGIKDDPRGAGYNVNQAKIAIGSGGLTGKGFLNGTQTKLRYVPEQHTDFIFCTVGEEAGFIGAGGVLLLWLFFIWRLIALAERQRDTFGRVYGYCTLSVFLFHLFINVGMALGLTPVIGIPLPFFSYGGSSLWGFTLLLFIFLRIDAERDRV